MSQSLVPQQPPQRSPVIRDALAPLANYLRAHARLISAAIPPRLQAQVNAGAVIASVLIDVEREPRLAECSPESLLRCTLLAVELGARVGAAFGEAYLVPYWNKNAPRPGGGKGCMEAQLQTGYRLLQRLAVECGAADSVPAHAVYAQEVEAARFDISLEPPAVMHKPIIIGKRGDLVGTWAAAKKNGQIIAIEWMHGEDLEKIERQARKKPGSDDERGAPAWDTWRDQMCIKAALKRMLKHVPAGIDDRMLRQAVLVDHRAETGQPQGDLLPIPAVQELPADDRGAAERAQAAVLAAQQQQALAARSEATGAALADLTGGAAGADPGAPSQQELDRAFAGDREDQTKRDQRKGR